MDRLEPPPVPHARLRHFWSHWSGPAYEPDDEHLDHLVSVYGPPGAFTASIAWYQAGAGLIAASLAAGSAKGVRRGRARGGRGLARGDILGPMRFRATVELGGKTATGIEIPEDVVAAWGSGSRPPVTVTIGGHTYRTTVARMGGRFLIPLSAENRTGGRRGRRRSG